MHIGDRLREERERLGLSQSDFAALVQATRKTLFNWETGAGSPSAEALAAWAARGLDVNYVVTGERDYEPPPALSAEERVMLDHFRQASKEGRRAALGALLGAAGAMGTGVNQVNRGHGAVQIGNINHPPKRRK